MNIIKNFFIVLFCLANISSAVNSAEYIYIFNDECINSLYKNAENDFKNTDIKVIRDSRGVILSFEFCCPKTEYQNITTSTCRNILKIKSFLAKIKNSAIIEVHTDKLLKDVDNRSNWEVSTIIANQLESVVVDNKLGISSSRIKSVGYGEFLPSQNHLSNVENYLNRVDIIVLCNVQGE